MLLVYQDNAVGVEHIFYVNALFHSFNKLEKMLIK